MVHERIQNRMRILFSASSRLASNRFRTIKPMVRGWGNVRPVGFDVTQMQAPGLIPELINPIYAQSVMYAVSECSLSTLAGRSAWRICQPLRISPLGPSTELATVPWILAFIPVFPEVPVVSHFGIGRLIRVQSIILFPGFKTTFAEQDAPGRLRIDADPLHPDDRAEMRLACQTDLVPSGLRSVPEGPFLQLERDIVVGRTMGRKVTSGINDILEARKPEPGNRLL